MTRIQQFFTTLLPKRWAESMKAESEMWKVRCLECGWTRSVWELGGLRWKAASVGKRVRVDCPDCQQPRWVTVKKEAPDSRESSNLGQDPAHQAS